MGPIRAGLALSAALFLRGLASATPDVTVVGDLSSHGRKAAHPAPGKPVYYTPVMSGYRELGDPVAGEPPVSPHAVVRVVAEELARRGYLVIDARHPSPDLIIDLSWGLIRPASEMPSGVSQIQGVTTDVKVQKEMNSLVLGNTISEVMPLESFNRQQFLEAARQDRYFLIVSAFDYGSFVRQHRHDLLWQTKMSVPTSGVFFNDIVRTLVLAGGPVFGNETVNHPKLQAVPEGQIHIGTPTVAEH